MRTRATLTACAAALAVLLAAGPAQAQSCPGADTPPGGDGTATKKALLCLVNAERAKVGRAPLKAEGRLKKAATGFVQELVAQQFFSHVGPGGETLLRRLEKVKYVTDGLRRYAFAENLGYGTGVQATPQAIVAGWLLSKDHKRNMLDPRFKQVGFGLSNGSPFGDDDARTVVADFGLRVT